MEQIDDTYRWQNCLDYIRDNVGEEVFKRWFSCVAFRNFANGMVTVNVPSDMYMQVFEHRFSGIIHSAMTKNFGADVDLQYTFGVIKDDKSSEVKISSVPKSAVIERERMQTQSDSGCNVFDSQLNAAYTFANYCEGKSNHVPYAMAKYVADHPETQQFNPFFLWGSVGVGKTHLIQAIGIQIREQNPRKKVLYTSLKLFQHTVQVAGLEKSLPDLINFYRNIDVLLIDDIQELKASAKTTMDTLFSVFKYLQMNNKKLIFTSDRPPMDLDGISDRLIDRFKWGLVEELPKPDLDLRKMILRRKARQSGLDLTERMIDMIAMAVDGSVRELEGVMMNILSHSIAGDCQITEALVRNSISKYVNVPKKREINMDMIVEATADYFNILPDVVFQKSRMRDIAEARQIIMFLTRKLTDLSLKAIGTKLNRAHTTVLHDIRTVENHLLNERAMEDKIAAIEEELRRNY